MATKKKNGSKTTIKVAKTTETIKPPGAKRGPKKGAKRAPLAVQQVIVEATTAAGAVIEGKMFRVSWQGETTDHTTRKEANNWLKAKKKTFRVPAYARICKQHHSRIANIPIADFPIDKQQYLGVLNEAYAILAAPYYTLDNTSPIAVEAVQTAPPANPVSVLAGAAGRMPTP